jgi:hypothetical protein
MINLEDDLSNTIIPKSDQLNADHFIAGDRTFTIERVTKKDSREQPVSVFFEGEQLPWKPCLSMRRALGIVWGMDKSAYTGRKITLFRDPTAPWGGAQVGGIRIKAMEGIDKPVSMSLTKNSKERANFTVQPLVVKDADTAADWVNSIIELLELTTDFDEFHKFKTTSAAMQKIHKTRPELFDAIMVAHVAAQTRLQAAEAANLPQNTGDNTNAVTE